MISFLWYKTKEQTDTNGWSCQSESEYNDKHHSVTQISYSFGVGPFFLSHRCLLAFKNDRQFTLSFHYLINKFKARTKTVFTSSKQLNFTCYGHDFTFFEVRFQTRTSHSPAMKQSIYHASLPAGSRPMWSGLPATTRPLEKHPRPAKMLMSTKNCALATSRPLNYGLPGGLHPLGRRLISASSVFC